jgi:uncharacterized phage protein gp47/JayE
MAKVPDLRSKEQIAGDFIDGIRARLRKDLDLNESSNLAQLVQAMAQELFKSEANLITMIDAMSADRAEGEQLQRQARDANVPILPALASTGRVDISDTSFTKVSSRVYAGQPAPVAGSLKIYVADASKFTQAGGKVYIGRGTANVEGPLTYTSVQAEAGGSYWSITLAGTSPTTKFHNLGEEVTLAQGGNRFIPSNTTIQTAQGASITAVAFVTTSAATIIDGEVTVTNVPVRCQVPGTIGNVSRGAIKEIIGVAFTGTVYNSLGFNNGREADTDDDIRQRIKDYESAKSKGTEQAIETASKDVVAKDELKKVQSSNVIRYADNTTDLVFDDGQGYEPNFVGAPFETVVDSAVGGEREVQLRQKPIAQALIRNNVAGPWPIQNLSFIAVEIAGVETVHQFVDADFKVPSSATAYEIAASINGDPNVNFLCTTNSDGTYLVIYPRDRSKNDIQVKVPSTGTNANDALGFPTTKAVTSRMYKNDLPLQQDGLIAYVQTRAKSSWSPAISDGDTLSYRVDGTPEVTTVFNLSDFQAIDPGATVSSLTDISIWAEVINNLMPGVSATVLGDIIQLQSARGSDNKAKLEITGGTLKNQIFSTTDTLYSVGQSPDYTLNKQTGQVGFTNALATGDKVTMGSQYTRGSALTSDIPNGPTQQGRVWLLTDGGSLPVQTGLKSNSQVTFSKTGTLLTISATSPALVPEGFDDIKEGDWLIVWANPTDPAPLIFNQGFWRIQSVQTGQIIVDDGTTSRSNLNISFTPITDRLVIVRSQAPMQMIDFAAQPLVSFLQTIQTSLVGVDAQIVGSKVRISTKTFSDDGEIYFAAADQGGSALQLPLGAAIVNTPAHYGNVAATDTEAGVPSFTHSTLGLAITDTVFTLPDFEAIGGHDGDFVEILNKYDTSAVKQVIDSNAGERSLITGYDTSLQRMSMKPPIYMQSPDSLMQAGDRFFLRSPYKFYSADTTNAVVDGNAETQSYTLPVSRKLTVSSHSTPSNQDFSASDAESSLALNDPASFYDFDFSNFKIHRQARTHLTDGTYDVLIKSADFGPSGNRVRVGFVYPDTATQTAISHRFELSEVIDAKIFLPCPAVRTPSWDYTSSFTVSKTTTGGKDVVTYTWRSGTEAKFNNLGADVHVGDIMFLAANTSFLPANSGYKGRVISVSLHSFSVEVPAGTYVVDNVSFTNMLNQAGTITVTAAGHGLSTGQRVGFWNTASYDGGTTFPLNTTYTVTVLNSNQFTVATPSGTPGGTLVNSSQVSNTVTITTSAAHNLIVSDVVLISGAGSPYDGLAAVSAVLGANQFQFIKSGSAASSGTGRFDFQSYSAGTTVSVSSISKAGTLMTANTATSHGLNPGDIVQVAGVTLDAYVPATTYAVGDLVSYSGQNYQSLQSGNVGHQPDISPTYWSVTILDLGGKFIVDSTPTSTQFKYYYSLSGSASGTNGTATRYVPTGSMARSLSGSTNENLQFATVSTTAQEVVDYISANMSDKLTASVGNGAPSATITRSTEDNDLGTNYISTTVTNFYTFMTSRRAKLRTTATIPAGSSIVISGMSGGAAAYNGSYIVLDTYLDQGIGAIVSEIQLPSLATATATLSPGGTVNGSTPMDMMYDGENGVLSNNLSSLASLPQFIAKKQWVSAPDIGEEIRLVAQSNEQLVRFWNKLVVTGVTNVGAVQLSRYGRELQISTQTFGGSGYIQVSGGTANSLSLALSGSGSLIGSKLGAVTVPYEIRQGLIKDQWVNLQNTVRQNKLIQLDETTAITLHADGAEIVSGSGTFQTIRSVSHTANTEIKIERQGNFVAIIGISGPSMNLISNGVKEGDWVRLNNVVEALYSSGTTYAISARVSYNGLSYTSLSNGNQNHQPDVSPAWWRHDEFDKANQGVFQVVRIFGNDSFWIEHENAAEEVIVLGNQNNMRFYDHESVMPGDTLVITTDSLGAQNVGRYIVVDESQGVGYSFPTATRIWTAAIPNPSGSPVILGGELSQFNVEESEPVSLWKRIFTVGPGAGTDATVVLDSPELTEKLSSSLGAVLIGKSKLNFDAGATTSAATIHSGIDAYKYYVGLIAELNKVIYGDPSDRINYPGWRAAGTAIGIKPAIIRRVTASFSIRTKSGVPFTEIRDRVKSAVAGYVNGLDVGQSVSISRMVTAAGSIPGVVSVAVTYPTYDASNDLIPIAADERARVVDPTTDVTISLI